MIISTQIRPHPFIADSLHINLFPSCPKVVLSIRDEFLLNDQFVQTTYEKILENKAIFAKLFSPPELDISLVSTENLDPKLLKEDGFGYEEVLKP